MMTWSRLATFMVCLWVGASACGGAKKEGASSPGPGGDKVIERAEGYSSRPAWADENRPWSRTESQIRVLGYVAIDGSQRMEMGFRAADSYARAELMRFLAVRVMAVLEDRIATGEADTLRERIEETARGVIDDLPVSGRYYERRRSTSGETLHVFSRIDLDRSTVFSLLERATSGSTDLRTQPRELLAQLEQRWDRVADIEALNQDQTLLPQGFPRPSWAEKGDGTDEDGFSFVCSGVADDPKQAKALAQARCNEKLCRLFGVQITAKTTVTEDLDGIEAQNQVTEQCAEVRVEGRETRYQSSECGPQGCVHWFLQTYPKSAYLAERKRLDQPQVIRQEVVIQEGDKRYRDPAACEASLRAYGEVKEQTSAGFQLRKQHLVEALRVCQGIDGRESGLFLAMDTLLKKPLARFTRPKPTDYGWGDWRWAFTVVSSSWQDELDTKRFLTDRIQAVLGLVDGAILPLQIMEMKSQGATAEQVDAVIQQVMDYPFVNRPATEHHLYFLHSTALGLASQKKVAFSPRYRRYLLAQVDRARVACSSRDTVNGDGVIAYLGADGALDETEWDASLRILRNSVEGDAVRCFSVLFDQNHGTKTAARLDQVTRMIVSGEIRTNDGYAAFSRLLSQVEKSDRLPIYLRYVSKLSGSDKALRELAQNVTRASFGWSWDYQNKDQAEGRRVCESLPQRMSSFFEDVPQAEADDTALCLCLKLDGVSPQARRGITTLLTKYADKTCDWIQPQDWPGTYYEQPTPKVIPYGQRAPFGANFKFIEDEALQCIQKHSVLAHPGVVTYLTVTLRGDRMSGARAETTLYGELKDFEYRDGRRGYVHVQDIHTMTEKLEGCFEEAVNRYVVPAAWSVTKLPGSHRLWFQIWGARTGTNGFVEDQ